MCYGKNGKVKFLETLADNVFRHNYSMMQIKKKIDLLENFEVTQVYTLKKNDWNKENVTCNEKCNNIVVVIFFLNN